MCACHLFAVNLAVARLARLFEAEDGAQRVTNHRVHA